MKKGSILPPLLLGAAVFAVSLFGLYNLTGRPGIRREHLGRPVVGIDAHEIRRTSDIRFALTRKKVGDPVVLRFGPDGGPAVVRDTIVPFYSQAPFPLATVLMGCVSFLAGPFMVLPQAGFVHRTHRFFARLFGRHPASHAA